MSFINIKPKEIKSGSIILAIVLYTFFINLGDIKHGLRDGWNSLTTTTTTSDHILLAYQGMSGR